jgi:hypothetical protein
MRLYSILRTKYEKKMKAGGDFEREETLRGVQYGALHGRQALDDDQAPVNTFRQALQLAKITPSIAVPPSTEPEAVLRGVVVSWCRDS